MRPCSQEWQLIEEQAFENALAMASADWPLGWYDKMAVIFYVLPVQAKESLVNVLPKPLGYLLQKFPLTWKPRKWFDASQYIARAYQEAGYPLFPRIDKLSPKDFITSKQLAVIWEGIYESQE